jgi:hypothetical protein
MKGLVCAVAALVLAGCSAVQSVPSQLQTVRPAIQESGGPFSASYAGHYSLTGCSPPDGEGRFSFDGTGSGSFIHNSTEFGSMGGFVYQGCPWQGTATLLNSAHPLNSITMDLSLAKGLIHPNNPCAPGPNRQIMFTVSGGTGRFRHATGSGTVVFTCNSGRYTDQWSGTISF